MTRTTIEDWKEANAALRHAQRAAMDLPPLEDFVTYFAGEMEEKDAEQMRNVLVAYPELAKAFATRVGDIPADEPVAVGATPNRWRGAIALLLAVLVAASIAGLLLRVRPLQPIAALAPQWIEPGLTCGMPVATPLYPDVDQHLLILGIEQGKQNWPSYSVKIFSREKTRLRQIWQGLDVSKTWKLRDYRDNFTILVPKELLPKGHYDIVVYAGKDETLEIERYYVSTGFPVSAPCE